MRHVEHYSYGNIKILRGQMIWWMCSSLWCSSISSFIIKPLRLCQKMKHRRGSVVWRGFKEHKSYTQIIWRTASVWERDGEIVLVMEIVYKKIPTWCWNVSVCEIHSCTMTILIHVCKSMYKMLLLWIIQNSFHEIMTKRKCKQAFCLLWTLNRNWWVLKIVLELRSYALLNFPFKKA